MNFDRFAKQDTFDFDGQTITIEKLKKMRPATQFKDETLPILIGQFRPLEVFFAAVVNEFAPLKDWGILDTMVMAEKDMDKCLLPAFKVMLEYYCPDRKYTPVHLESLVYDYEWLYSVVYSQMKAERVTEYYLRRKMSFIMDMAEFAKLGITVDDISAKLENAIRSVAKAQQPDKEFAGAVK